LSYTQNAFENGAYYVKLAAGKEYKKNRLHQWFWGTNNRQLWTTPVRVKIVSLDTLYGGLKPYKRGGGNESKTLRLRSEEGKEYVLRSVNKTRNAVIPGILRGSFFAGFIQDGVSQSHPYASLAIATMCSVASVYHPEPILVYVPSQPALHKYNDHYGNNLYLIEERPDGNWSTTNHMGNFVEFESTLKLLKKMKEDNAWSIDQAAYIKSRLFDVLLADWDRQQDNWRWGIHQTGSKHFIPFSRDRDQALFSTNGKMTRLLMPLMHVEFMQDLSSRKQNTALLTSQDRELDRIFSNEMEKEDWVQAAGFLKNSLTDSVIEASVKKLPAEIYALSGATLIRTLQYRRNQLDRYALDFYTVLAKKVDVNGSAKDERFEVKKLGEDKVLINLFRINNGSTENDPYYSRVFVLSETKRVNLYGFGGKDVFVIDENIKEIQIRFHKGENKNPLFKRMIDLR
jgi:hypothetical protein